MPDTKPYSAARTVLSFANDVLIAGVAAGLGAALGWTIFLVVASINEGRFPRSGDLGVLPWVVILGLTAGAIGGALLRCGIGKIQGQALLAVGFFLLGSVAGPVALIALIAYAMAGTGGW